MPWRHVGKSCVKCVFTTAVILVIAVLALSPLCLAHSSSALYANSSFTEIAIQRQATSLSPGGGQVSLVYLNNGSSAEFSLEWRITLEAAEDSIDDYDVTYECEDSSILDGSSDCRVELESITARAVQDLYAGRVFCVASRFPGLARCRLVARPTASATGSSLSSPEAEIIVAGMVFYDLEGVSASGAVTKDTVIYTGTGREYFEPDFADVDTPPRLFGVRTFFPSGTRGVGDDAGFILNEASMFLSESEPIFLYDKSSCSPGNFSRPKGTQETGAFVLAPAETCGFGTALNGNDTDALVGVRIRPFKAGVKTLRFEWIDFDTKDTLLTPYTQTFTVRVEGSSNPPPVVVEVVVQAHEEGGSGDLFSTPCSRAEDGLFVRMYNIDAAENIIVRLARGASSDEGVGAQDWVEDVENFVYDPLTDSFSAFFSNRGGSGRNLSYSIVASTGSADGNERIAAFPVAAEAPEGINFADGVSIGRVIPSVTPFKGGPVVLEGTFFGIDVENGDKVLTDGERVDNELLGVINSSHVELTVPGIENDSDIVDITFEVEVCGIVSNAASLLYGAIPNASIWSLDLSLTDDVYPVPDTTETIVFVADAGSSNLNLSYMWSLSGPGGSDLVSDESAMSLPTFSLDPSLMDSGGDFTLSLFLENRAGNSTASVVLRRPPAGTASLAVALHPLPLQTRLEGNEPTLVQASVQVFGLDLTESRSRIVLEWMYDGKKYQVDDLTKSANSSLFDPGQTGPTLFGRQLSIANKDLVVGISSVSLNAFVDTNPSLGDEAVLDLLVQESSLSVVINEGVNGTTIASSKSLTLASVDTIGADSDAILNGNATYEWFDCRTSSDIAFDGFSPSCLALFPQLRWGLQTVEISADEVSSVLPSGVDEVFISFGLRVSQGLNFRTAYVLYRVVRSTARLKSPTSMKLQDANGYRIDSTAVDASTELSLLVDSESSEDTFTFSVRSESGNELSGEWFSRSDADRGLLTIPAGILAPGSSYIISIELMDGESGDSSLTQLLVRTRPIPRLHCSKPSVSLGVAQETSFVVSAETDLFSADMRYCFYLVNRQTLSRFAIGIGCSTSRAAKFEWPVIGTYDLECEVQSSNGETLSRVDLEEISEVVARDGSQSVSEVAPARADIGSSGSGAVLGTLAVEQSKILDECERAGDHVCVRQLASILPQLIAETSMLPNLLGRAEQTAEVANSTVSADFDVPAELPALVTKLCGLLRLMGTQTVFTAEGIASTILSAESMVEMPPTLYDDEALLGCLFSTSLAVEAAGSSSALPLRDDRVLKSIQRVANLSITAASLVSSSGSGRERLAANVNKESEGPLFALFLSELPLFVARMIIQREECGFKSDFDTAVQGGSDFQPPIQLHLRVLCDATNGVESASEFRFRNELSGSDVKVTVCPEALAEGKFPLVVKQTDPSQFCSSGVLSGLFAVFTSPTSITFPSSPSLPSQCISLKLPRLSEHASCARVVPVDDEDDTSKGPEASAEESEVLLPDPEVRAEATSAPFVPNLLGGVINGLGTISSGAGAVPQDMNVRVNDSENQAVITAEYVSFLVKAPGEFVAGFPRDPGDGPPTGVNNTKVVLVVCLVTGCCVVALAGVAASQSQWVAGVPPRSVPDDIYLERDTYGRVIQPSAEEMTDAPGYAAQVESPIAKSADSLPKYVTRGDEQWLAFQVPSGRLIHAPEYHEEEEVVMEHVHEEEVADVAIASAPYFDELRDVGYL